MAEQGNYKKEEGREGRWLRGLDPEQRKRGYTWEKKEILTFLSCKMEVGTQHVSKERQTAM